MVPNQWLLEGGESATGALLDHIVTTHPAYAIATQQAKDANIQHMHVFLNQVCERLAKERGLSDVALLTRDLHLLPYFHGNRSPRADSSLLGVWSGLSLDCGLDDLAVKYLATLQALAYGTRHIREAMQSSGVQTTSLFLTGGLAKNALFVQQHADANECACFLPRESDGVLLGAGIAAATAGGLFPSLSAAMQHMSFIGSTVQPAKADTEQAQFHGRKFKVFLTMYEAFVQTRRIMNEE